MTCLRGAWSRLRLLRAKTWRRMKQFCSQRTSFASTHFGSLPTEIRIQICEYALQYDEPLRISPGRTSEPALLRTCRQLREETELMFYSLNRFESESDIQDLTAPHLRHWLRRVSGDRLALVQRLTIVVQLPDHYPKPGKYIELRKLDEMATLTRAIRSCDVGPRSLGSLVHVRVNGWDDLGSLYRDRRPADDLEIYWRTSTAQHICWYFILVIVFGEQVREWVTGSAPFMYRRTTFHEHIDLLAEMRGNNREQQELPCED